MDLDRERIHSRYRLRELERVAVENVNRAILEARSDDELTPRRWDDPNGGDAQKLRGIPVVGSGMGGAIPGTSPHNVRIDSAYFAWR